MIFARARVRGDVNCFVSINALKQSSEVAGDSQELTRRLVDLCLQVLVISSGQLISGVLCTSDEFLQLVNFAPVRSAGVVKMTFYGSDCEPACSASLDCVRFK